MYRDSGECVETVESVLRNSVMCVGSVKCVGIVVMVVGTVECV